MIFDKPPLPEEKHLELLESRGLEIPDRTKALRCLRYIGYYRLSGYFYFFLNEHKKEHSFRKGVTFNDVVKLYSFDRKMRLLLLSQVEKVEVAFRARISDIMGKLTGNAHWYLDNQYFEDSEWFIHAEFIEEIRKAIDKKKNSAFVEHYKKQYTSPDLPPSWMIFEVVSFGTIVMLFKHLNSRHSLGHFKKKIANEFNLPVPALAYWMEACNSLRNICAHHERVWNASFIKKPTFKIDGMVPLEPGNSGRLYPQLLMLCILLKSIHPGSDLFDELKALLSRYPEVPKGIMGFPTDWENESVWHS